MQRRNRNPEGHITISHYIIKVTNSDKEAIKTSRGRRKWKMTIYINKRTQTEFR